MKPATPVIVLTAATLFYFAMNSAAPAGWLGNKLWIHRGCYDRQCGQNAWREV
ncbi:hypothetical protein [Paenibacillus sp. HW567]|uniref:hypothetical protein n=1 Tax=Paenibacillus sp. HW567 TaxID=1034769 RepID=UPI0012EC3DCE|nr:hypothetical protein [Paenibacillus sp. HW567]